MLLTPYLKMFCCWGSCFAVDGFGQFVVTTGFVAELQAYLTEKTNRLQACDVVEILRQVSKRELR